MDQATSTDHIEGYETASRQKVRLIKVWAKPPSRAAFPALELQETRHWDTLDHTGWNVYVYHKGRRRFYTHYDDNGAEQTLQRHRDHGNTIEESKVVPAD